MTASTIARMVDERWEQVKGESAESIEETSSSEQVLLQSCDSGVMLTEGNVTFSGKEEVEMDLYHQKKIDNYEGIDFGSLREARVFRSFNHVLNKNSLYREQQVSSIALKTLERQTNLNISKRVRLGCSLPDLRMVTLREEESNDGFSDVFPSKAMESVTAVECMPTVPMRCATVDDFLTVEDFAVKSANKMQKKNFFKRKWNKLVKRVRKIFVCGNSE